MNYSHSYRVLYAIAICCGIGCSGRESQGSASIASGSSCPGAQQEGEPGDIALAKCLATPALPAQASVQAAPSSVVVYVDRSASMRGFLDPGYPAQTPTDYRSVIDEVIVGLHPTSGFSFGASVRPIVPSLATLSSKGFYNDRDTRMEDVFAAIGQDTGEVSSHVIVTDGRRGSPGLAIAQFVNMRDLAERWIAGRGSLAVATSLAPFKTVSSDPSGCRRGDSADGAQQTCPLYAFAFIRPGEQAVMLARLAGAFEHVFTWPVLTTPSDRLAIAPPEPATPELQFQPRWSVASGGAPIARARGDAPSTKLHRMQVTVVDTTSTVGRGYWAALGGFEVIPIVAARALRLDAIQQKWQPVSGVAALVQPAPDGRALRIGTHGQSGQKALYRVDLMPTGEPSWLSEFDAVNAHDVVRTYALGRLFESFRIQAKSVGVQPAARVYVVVN